MNPKQAPTMAEVQAVGVRKYDTLGDEWWLLLIAKMDDLVAAVRLGGEGE